MTTKHACGSLYLRDVPAATAPYCSAFPYMSRLGLLAEFAPNGKMPPKDDSDKVVAIPGHETS
ncbi:MAG TPA: hypothetical protein VNN25_23225 [Thermoanaerobaculia bacterium]|nr:hypothetical protein [Thermoanaerobaculia bacterium]